MLFESSISKRVKDDYDSRASEVQQERVCRVGLDGPHHQGLDSDGFGMLRFLRSSDLGVRVAALDCVLELGWKLGKGLSGDVRIVKEACHC
ncbi:hypothetical protein glysoja_023243 [Glycine soja]|nr:hypothetical protein glysoja_023243 [Glycine soja]